MSLAILIPVIVTAAIQSLFGVGVLLFGTPILLLLGFGFLTALPILLPISISINLLQILAHRAHIDWKLFRKILLYTIPFVVLCLALVTRAKVNVGLVIGLFLLFVASKDFSGRADRMVQSLMRHERAYLVVMGVVHGLTNLGGSLLTALVHAKHYPKDTTRVTTAIAYCTFAVFQLVTLAVTARHVPVHPSTEVLYVGTGVMIYALVDRAVYVAIDDARYRRLFAAFLFASGCVLVYKSLAG